MNIFDYLTKSSEISILDMLLIAVLASILSPIIVYLAKKLFTLYVKAKNRVNKKVRYYKRLKSGRISFADHRLLEEKEKAGNLSKLERQALKISRKKIQESMEKLSENLPDLPELPKILRKK